MTTLRLNANLSLYFFILFLGLLNCWFLRNALRYKFYLIIFFISITVGKFAKNSEYFFWSTYDLNRIDTGWWGIDKIVNYLIFDANAILPLLILGCMFFALAPATTDD